MLDDVLVVIGISVAERGGPRITVVVLLDVAAFVTGGVVVGVGAVSGAGVGVEAGVPLGASAFVPDVPSSALAVAKKNANGEKFNLEVAGVVVGDVEFTGAVFVGVVTDDVEVGGIEMIPLTVLDGNPVTFQIRVRPTLFISPFVSVPGGTKVPQKISDDPPLNDAAVPASIVVLALSDSGLPCALSGDCHVPKQDDG